MKEQIVEIEEAIRDVYWCMVAEVAHGKKTDRAMLTPNNLIEFLYASVFQVNARGSRLESCAVDCTKTIRDRHHQVVVLKQGTTVLKLVE